MKKLFILLIIALLCSCTNPVNVTNVTSGITVLDSCWNLVPADSLRAARAVGDLETIQEAVTEYNASNIDDHWFLYVGEYPNLENAPPCTIYIVDKVTHEVVKYSDGVGGFITLKWENWNRAEMVANKEAWKLDAVHANADLYIDVIPPAPIVVIPTAEQIYIANLIYVVNSIGEIKFEEHCSETFLEFEGNWTLTEYFNSRLWAWNEECRSNATDGHTPWRVVSGQIYTQGAL